MTASTNNLASHILLSSYAMKVLTVSPFKTSVFVVQMAEESCNLRLLLETQSHSSCFIIPHILRAYIRFVSTSPLTHIRGTVCMGLQPPARHTPENFNLPLIGDFKEEYSPKTT